MQEKEYYFPLRQIEMQEAQYRPTVFPYRRPFIMYDEVFVRISTFLPNVQDYLWVSQYGNVYNENYGYLSTVWHDPHGYPHVWLRKKEYAEGEDPNLRMPIHRLVGMAFLGVPNDDSLVINHKDFNRNNPHVSNLEWITQAENIRYSVNAGRFMNGEAHVSSKYPPELIHKLCALLQSGVLDPTTISHELFGCDPTPAIYGLIQDVRSGKHWANISSQYNIPELEHRTFARNDIIHAMCQYLQDHPDAVHDKTVSATDILSQMGYDVPKFTDLEKHRYRSALSQIRRRKAYAKIISQYNIQFDS